VRKRNGSFLVVCIAVLAAIVFFEPSYGWKFRAFLDRSAASPSDGQNLAAQNQVLMAELAKLQSVAAQMPDAPSGYIRAMVYSRYPMNFKNEILADAGENVGVFVGKAVTFQGVLVGSVEKIFKDSSLIQTVFDGTFKVPVRVGNAGYDALFTGGSYPKAVSIRKNAPVHVGDIVYAAAPGLPYGLPIAVVSATSTSPDDLFEEAELSFAYDINGIQTVLIAK